MEHMPRRVAAPTAGDTRIGCCSYTQSEVLDIGSLLVSAVVRIVWCCDTP